MPAAAMNSLAKAAKRPSSRACRMLPHEVQVEIQVVDGVEPGAQDLVALVQVPQVGPGIVAAGVAAAFRVDGAGVRWHGRIANIQHAVWVNRWPLRAWRVGITQSNMSTPRATAAIRSSGRPTPIR